MERIICIVMGYVFGLFQTGYLYGKKHGIDIRQHGSGNAGATNTLRVLGKKAGLIVFLGDFFKTVIPCVIVRAVFGGKADMVYLLVLYTGLGVILGHNYPFYLKFQGGKGIAATAGLLAATDVRIMLVCLVIFAVTVAVTRYVSLGSLLVVTAFFAMTVFFGLNGDYGLGGEYLYESFVVAAVVMLMAYWRHRANIVRLLKGTENKIGGKKR